jgi:hypothetical protein
MIAAICRGVIALLTIVTGAIAAVIVGSVKLLATGAYHLWDWSRPAWTTLLDRARKVGAKTYAGLAFAIGWVLSVKDDLAGPVDVNPVLMVGKLLILVSGGVLIGILLIRLFR